MRVQGIAVLGFLLCKTSLGFAIYVPTPSVQNKSEAVSANKSQGAFSKASLGFLYSYTEFDFDSTKGLNFNRFHGHSNLYGLGGDNVLLLPTLTAGVYVYKADTSVSSHVFLAPGLPSTIETSNLNHTLFGHILKQFNQHFFVDVAGAYGENRTTIQSVLAPGTVDTQFGYAKPRSSNWFTTVTGLYTTPWKKFILSANARVLYSQIDAESYFFNFQPTMPTQLTPSLTNKVLFVMENAEIGYKFKPTITPFINGGLIQVAHYSNSRPIITTAINGALPQLNMNQNGYKLGGGISFTHKAWALRLEQQYYNSAGTFTSNQTLVSVKYQIA